MTRLSPRDVLWTALFWGFCVMTCYAAVFAIPIVFLMDKPSAEWRWTALTAMGWGILQWLIWPIFKGDTHPFLMSAAVVWSLMALGYVAYCILLDRRHRREQHYQVV